MIPSETERKAAVKELQKVICSGCDNKDYNVCAECKIHILANRAFQG